MYLSTHFGVFFVFRVHLPSPIFLSSHSLVCCVRVLTLCDCNQRVYEELKIGPVEIPHTKKKEKVPHLAGCSLGSNLSFFILSFFWSLFFLVCYPEETQKAVLLTSLVKSERKQYDPFHYLPR